MASPIPLPNSSASREVLTLEGALTALPGEASAVHRWLVKQGLVQGFLGAQVVVWDDVLDALRFGALHAGRARLSPPQPGEILSEDRAARALPWRRSDAVAWLREQGLSRVVDRRRIVVWDDVIRRLRAPEMEISEPTGWTRRGPAAGGPPHLAEPGRCMDG